MGKEPAATKTSPADEIEGILQDGKKKELNFVMMKTKEGIALKAGSAAISHGKLVAQCKEAGGMPAVSMKGTMTVSGRTLQIVPLPDEPLDPSTLKKLARGVKPFCKAAKMRPFKLVATLPDGTVIDSDAVEEEGEEGENEQKPDAPVVPGPQQQDTAPNSDAPETNDDPDAQMKAQLSERIKALVPQVKDAVGKAIAGADKFAKGLQAAGAEIGKGAYEQAAKLIDAVEQGLKAPQGHNDTGVDPAAMRDKLLQEFNAFSGDLKALGERAAENVAKKANQFATMFQTELDGDLKKAGAILSALKKFVDAELAKLAPQQDVGDGGSDPEGLFDDLVGGVTNIAGTIKSTVSDGLTKVSETISSVKQTVVEGVQDVVTAITQTDTEKKARASLDAFGFTREEREEMMEKMKTDPKAVEKFKTGKMNDAGVPPDRQAELLKMSEDNPKAFVAALASLTSMKATDISPDAMQTSLEEFQKARAANEIKQKELAAANTALADSLKKYGELSGAASTAKTKADEAAQAIKDLANRIGDPKALTNEQRAEFLKESKVLTEANELAKAELAKALKAEKQGSMDYAAASEKKTKAQEAADKSKAKQDETQKVNDAKLGKQSLLDAMAFGPLSGTGTMADEDKAKFAEAFGKNPKVAGGAMNMMTSASDPAAIAANVGFLADKANDGFADEDGNKLDLPPDQIAAMALNAARMGGEMGPDYFKGFGDYLKTGKQLDPDPSGGLDEPLSDSGKEEIRRKNVAQARTRDLANSALNPDGTVDFGSDAAKGQMDHMLFHPGSLNVFTPQMNLKAAETQKLFTDDKTKAKAQGIITGTTVPGPSTPEKPTSPNSSKTLIGKTMGKDPATVTDTDARASVLSAMMTPMSQGPVGSCFSTAPVRAIRETDPLRAMDEYSKIATTGLFTPKGGVGVPANQRFHEGENPLMRSWEYSVATTAANINNSVQRQRVNKSLMRDDDTANNLGAVKGIMGSTDAEWNGYNDPISGDAVEGMKSKLLGATAKRLKFDYNATAPKGGVAVGGGDGHSTEGRYQLLFDGVAINSEAEFKAAIQTITLDVTGEAADSPKGAQIVTLVNGAPFIQSVKDALKTGGIGNDYMPWQLGGGGQEPAAKKVLDGGSPVKQDILANIGTPAPTRSERTASVLTAVMGKHGTMVGDMALMGTSGTNAGHAFNALPNDPSMDKIRDPDSAGKIDRELVQPGIRIATTALPIEQCAKMYRDEVSRLLSVLPSDEQAVLVGLMRNVPTTALTPAEIAAKVKTEAKAVLPQVRADRYVRDKEPAADGPRKAVILTFYENNFDTGTGASIENNLREKMMEALPVPQVTVADSNWGGSENQVYFVAAPDPLTGDLIMWKRTDPGGKMAPLGKNWEDGPWNWTKP